VSFKLVGIFRALFQSTQFFRAVVTSVSTSCKNQPSFVEIDLSLLSIRTVVHGYIIYLISLQGIAAAVTFVHAITIKFLINIIVYVIRSN